MSLRPLTVIEGIAVPLLRPNIDTDAIIPSREMKGVSKTGLADGLFAGWRYREIGGRIPDPDFVLNDAAYRGATILLGGENFGCGSSREHAVWALAEYGFRAILAPSFAPIFQNNCIRNGLLPAALPSAFVSSLADVVAKDPPRRPLRLDLPEQLVFGPNGEWAGFEIAEEAKQMLLHGLDPIALTLTRLDAIERFRAADRERRPWAYLHA